MFKVALVAIGLAPLSCASRSAESVPATSCAQGAYPSSGALAVGAALPDLSFEGVTEGGSVGTIRLHDYYEPCAPQSRLLVVRVQGGTWCGTCLWHAAHTGELLALAGGRLRVVDVVLGDRDNAPATGAEVPRWQSLLDSRDRVAVGVDPSFALREFMPATGAPLPLYVFVDTRTMQAKSYLPNPDPVALADEVDRDLASLDGKPAPVPRDETLVDGRFHRNEWDMIHDVAPPGAPPADATNAVADLPAAAALGKELFSDATLSPSGKVSCATCHDPQKQLTDGLPQAKGMAPGDRKTPRIALAAFSRWQFWDGRVDTLWAQALGPMENANEFASTRLWVAHRIAEQHATSYASVFPSSSLAAIATLPPSGKPGDASYDALSTGDQAAVTRLFVNAGKAIAAYERTFRTQPNALDAYGQGDQSALTSVQKQGLSVFVRAGCMQCHWGPRLTDDAFHVTRTPTGRVDGLADRGRIDGVTKLIAGEFLASSQWSDEAAPLPGTLVAAPSLLGAFKTPPLRGVAGAAPYGHGGMLPTLTDVTHSYGAGGMDVADSRAAGVTEPWIVRFGETTQWSIAAFLPVLTGTPIVP